MPKKLYLVRHAESEQSAQNIYQHTESPLSDDGKQQADALSRRFAQIKIDKIYSSPHLRTVQTAQFIATVIGAPIEKNDLVRELKRPSEFVGRKLDDLEPLRIKKLIEEHRDDASWHFSDEENFYDLLKRLREFVEFLERDTSDHVLVVSHAILIQSLSALLIFGDFMNPDISLAMYRRTRLTPTGITLFEYGQHGWRLMTWNDFVHLGEDSLESFYK